MIERTYVIKADEETGYSSKGSVGNRLDEVTFFCPKKVYCIDHDIPEHDVIMEEWDKEEVDQLIRDAKKEGCEEAWALARKIAGTVANGSYDWPTLREIFGNDWSTMKIFDDHYETVKKKIFDYENTPKVGDIVTFKDPDSGSDRAVVTFVSKGIDNPNDWCYGLLYDDGTSAVFSREDLVKTDEHVDLSDIFAKLKGED